jgi:hypothetical protein
MNIYIYIYVFFWRWIKTPYSPPGEREQGKKFQRKRGTTAKGMALDESIVFPLSVQCGVLFGSGKTAVDMLLP